MKISSTDRLFVLTGAGVSAESGLPTFRDAGGIWQGPAIEQVCTPDAWKADPWKVWEFYSSRRKAVTDAQPNTAHYALSEMESRLGDRFFLCTQNVDDLHEKAGSSRLLVHLHGEIHKSRCSQGCSEPVQDSQTYGSLAEVPSCSCGARMRPHVVFFDEDPLELDRVEDELFKATIMLVVGTSGTVQPAANLVVRAKRRKIPTVYVGLENPKNSSKFSEIILGRAGGVLPRLIP